MTRGEIVRATYAVAERLNDIKHGNHLIDEETFQGVSARLQAARQLMAEADQTHQFSHTALDLANHGTMFGDDELKWPIRHAFRVGGTLVRYLAMGLVHEMGHTAARLAGRYDGAALEG